MTVTSLSRRLGVGAFSVALAVGIAACSSSGSSSSGGGTTSTSTGTASGSASPTTAVKAGGTFTYAIDQDLPGFNINQVDDDEFVLQEVMNEVWPSVYYTTNNLTQQLNTNLVTSVKDSTTSPQTITYNINPKAVWSDGTPITAADFVYSWQSQSGNAKYTDVGGKAFEPASTAGYNQIKSVTSSNGGKTATVVFAKPFADWQSLFSNIIPAHEAKKVGFNNGFQNFSPALEVSGGPFQITSYAAGQDVVETPNPKWWGPKVQYKSLVFKIITDDNQIPPALQNNEVTGANPAQASLQFKDAIASVPSLTTNILAGLEFQHIDFNQSNFYLAQLNVRQALVDGTNRADLVNRIVGPITSTVKPLENRIFVPGQPQYTNTSGAYGDYSVAKAKALLTAAGMTMGSDGYFHPKAGPEAGQDLSFSISTTSGEPVRAEIEQLFQSYMKAIGVKITIQNYTAAQLFGTIGPKSEFQIIEFAWVATPFASANQTIYCTYTNTAECGENWDHFANKTVDSLFDSALTSLSPTKAAADYNEIDSLLWKNAVTLPLYQEPQLYTYSSQWGNILANPSSQGLTWNAGEWGLKAQ